LSELPWWKSGVIYQIYPRSFADSNGDGIGDLAGITSRLDYLADLPVDAIWLSPFYPSPMADFGYDVADYCDVHPLFGTMADFDALVEGAHARGIKVVVDWVPCHTSDQHEWFAESRSSRDNAKRDWYVWRDAKPDGSPPNNWLSCFERIGQAWTLDPQTGQYYLHSFMPEQPDLNWENQEVRAAMYDTLRFWLDRDVDGFRIDVTHRLGKDPELRDNPYQVIADTRKVLAALKRGDMVDADQRMDENWPSTHERLREIRAVVDEYDDRAIVGEVYLLNQRELVQYVNSGDELHLAHNFTFVNQPWGAADFREVVDEWHLLASELAWPDWFLENHDHSRVASRYDSGGNGAARARLASLMVLTLRGTPFLFQGEELGLPDVPVPAEQVVDVDNRDPERCPIPWEPPSVAGPGAGFTTGTPWLPISPAAETINARAQSADPSSALSLHRALLELRRGCPALVGGDYRSLDVGGGEIYAYLRETPDERLLVALNFGAGPASYDGAAAGLGDDGELLISTDPQRPAGRADLRSLVLGPAEGVVVRVTPQSVVT
jgi:alpha-glucosidase